MTNEIYQHLNQPKGFLFCPTQYCASRAVPDVRNSEYLNTIGSKLAPGIDILWTGDKVVSRSISVSSIDEVSEVFRRKPVIWDNLHANDYDKRRLFLGTQPFVKIKIVISHYQLTVTRTLLRSAFSFTFEIERCLNESKL